MTRVSRGSFLLSGMAGRRRLGFAASLVALGSFASSRHGQVLWPGGRGRWRWRRDHLARHRGLAGLLRLRRVRGGLGCTGSVRFGGLDADHRKSGGHGQRPTHEQQVREKAATGVGSAHRVLGATESPGILRGAGRCGGCAGADFPEVMWCRGGGGAPAGFICCGGGTLGVPPPAGNCGCGVSEGLTTTTGAGSVVANAPIPKAARPADTAITPPTNSRSFRNLRLG